MERNIYLKPDKSVGFLSFNQIAFMRQKPDLYRQFGLRTAAATGSFVALFNFNRYFPSMIHARPQPAPSEFRLASPETARPIPVQTQAGKAGKIMFPTLEGFCFEKIKHIAYLEADGNYTVLHFTDGRQTLVCKTLGDVERMLPADYFIRIHRSHTIHLRHIVKYTRGKGGQVTLKTGVTLTVASNRRDDFLSALQQFF
jgi:DNA-binding LytR/AlgR family response regulator